MVRYRLFARVAAYSRPGSIWPVDDRVKAQRDVRWLIESINHLISWVCGAGRDARLYCLQHTGVYFQVRRRSQPASSLITAAEPDSTLATLLAVGHQSAIGYPFNGLAH